MTIHEKHIGVVVATCDESVGVALRTRGHSYGSARMAPSLLADKNFELASSRCRLFLRDATLMLSSEVVDVVVYQTSVSAITRGLWFSAECRHDDKTPHIDPCTICRP